ncbi:MAG TPA: class I SAM-dependent methyltransferase [Thermoplasmata archaeon]|nr:class I SAM-dependent methyltransferase [Thermoplasmata archaeon]
MGFHTVWLTYLGRRYGLLKALEGRARQPADLAKSLRLHAPAVDTWCQAATAVGLIRHTAKGYALPRAHRELVLAEASRRYLGGQFEYAAAMSLDYGRFDALFRDGRSLSSLDRLRATQAVEAATIWDHTAFLEIALPRLRHVRGHLVRGARVLDVGCGAGVWMVRAALRFPKSEFVGVDPDLEALTRARRHIERNDLEERVTAELGSGSHLDYAREFDLAYLGEVLSQVRDPVGTLKHVRRTLKPRAHLVLLEGLRPATVRKGDLVTAMGPDQALHGARFFSRPELARALKAGGLRPRTPIHLGGGLWAVAAEA